MNKLTFHSNTEPTLGVELELGLVDGETMELTSAVQELLGHLAADAASELKPELMQSVIEINTGICRTVAEAEADLTRKLRTVENAADNLGLRLWWGATHPFSSWLAQEVTPDERYLNLVESVARDGSAVGHVRLARPRRRRFG